VLLLRKEEVIGLLMRYGRIDQGPWVSRTSIFKDVLYASAELREMRIWIVNLASSIEVKESVTAFIVEKSNLLLICAIEQTLN
jgi:hypothetical protein